MEQTIRLLETEIRNQKANLEALEFDKTNLLNEAMYKQQRINDDSEKLIAIEKELNTLYVKFPSVEPGSLATKSGRNVGNYTQKLSAETKKGTRSYDREDDELD